MGIREIMIMARIMSTRRLLVLLAVFHVVASSTEVVEIDEAVAGGVPHEAGFPMDLEQFSHVDLSSHAAKQTNARQRVAKREVAAEYAGRPEDSPGGALSQTGSPPAAKPHKVAVPARPPHPDDHIERQTLAPNPGDEGPDD